MPLVPSRSVPSSPTMASSGRRSARPSTIVVSAALSNTVTRSVSVDLVPGSTTAPRRPARAASPARTARSVARASKSAAAALTGAPPSHATGELRATPRSTIERKDRVDRARSRALAILDLAPLAERPQHEHGDDAHPGSRGDGTDEDADPLG